MSARKHSSCIHQKRPMHASKEAYAFVMYTSMRVCACMAGVRGLCMHQKRPMHASKEAYACITRGLCTHHKRPMHTSKEAYACMCVHDGCKINMKNEDKTEKGVPVCK